MAEVLPALAAALERRYPGLTVSAEMGEFDNSQRRRIITFVGPPGVLLAHGLLPAESQRSENFGEFGTRIYVCQDVCPQLQVAHFDLTDTGYPNIEHPRSNPCNAETRAAVAKIVARVAKGVSHG